MEWTDGSVLIVDGDDYIRTSMVRLLRSEGIESIGTSTAEAALELLHRVRESSRGLPTVIVLDLGLPGMTAREFRRSQLADPMLADIPVIVASADAWAREVGDALGAIAVFHKPVDVDRFVSIVRSIIADRFR